MKNRCSAGGAKNEKNCPQQKQTGFSEEKPVCEKQDQMPVMSIPAPPTP